MCWIWGAERLRCPPGGAGGAQSVFASIFQQMVGVHNSAAASGAPCDDFRERRRANFQDFPRKQFDRVIAVFMVSYLTALTDRGIPDVRSASLRAVVHFTSRTHSCLHPPSGEPFTSIKGRDYFRVSMI